MSTRDHQSRNPELVPGLPPRLVPVDEEAERELKKRTLTNLYNERPTCLTNAHAALRPTQSYARSDVCFQNPTTLIPPQSPKLPNNPTPLIPTISPH